MAAITTAPILSLKNVLYATDFSEASRAALPYAISVAQRFASTLQVVHVVTPVTNVIPFEPFPMDNRGPAEEQMTALLHSDLLKNVSHCGRVEEGNLWNVLQELIEQEDFDLAVLGTHGRSRIRHLALGSVAEEIIRSAPCPVLTVGPNVSQDATPEFSLRRILCAADLQPDSGKAVAYSVALAQQCGGRLTFVHAIQALDGDRACPSALKWDVKRLLESLLPVDANLSSAADFVIEFGAPAEVILHCARKQQPDLIVLGVKHVDHPWLASHAAWVTIHEVLTYAECPVLTVRM